MAVVVVAMEIFDLATLDSLDLSLIPPRIAIYPPRPLNYGFDLDLDSVSILDRQHHLGCPQFPPLLGFSDGLVFLARELIIMRTTWVWVWVKEGKWRL